MLITKCDRCNKIFDSVKEDDSCEEFKYEVIRNIPHGRICLDLCLNCKKELVEWLHWRENK